MNIEIIKKQEAYNGAALQVRAALLNEDRAELVERALQKLAQDAKLVEENAAARSAGAADTGGQGVDTAKTSAGAADTGVDNAKAGADAQGADEQNTNEQNPEELLSLLEEKLGKEQLIKNISHFVYEGISGLVCAELDLDIMFEPKFKNHSSKTVLDEGGLELDMEYILQPALSLSSYEPVSVAVRENKLNNELINSYINDVLEQHGHWDHVNREVQEGDYILVDMQTKCNGELEENLSGEHLSVELSFDKMPRSFVENVIGMKVGDQKKFSFTAFDTSYAGSDNQAKKDKFDVELTLKDICIKVVPELNDRFVCEALTDCGSTVAEFKEKVSYLLKERIDIENKQKRELAVDAELATRLTDAIPDIYIEHTAADLYANLRENLSAQNITITQYMQSEGLDKRQFQMSILSQARDATRQGLALDALFRHLNYPLKDKDIERALGELAPGRIEEARARFKYNGTWSLVKQMAKRLKAHDWLIATATFK